MRKIFTAVILAALSATTFAQSMPTPEEIAAKRAEAMKALGSIPSAGQGVQQQMNSNGAGANAAAAINSPSSPLRSNATQAEFMNLARPGYAPPEQAQQKPAKADLMIFVSLSMPAQMLEQYAVQAKRFGAVLMLRGFVNDKLSDTKEALQKLNSAGAQWEISPEPFKHFKVDKVPAIVMATAESSSITEEGCAKPETYTAIFGDMSVLAALDQMSLRAQKTISLMAKARILADRQAAKK